MFVNHGTNLAKAIAAWGGDLPDWVRLLASACDTANQRSVAERLGKSPGYVSRLINQSYAGSYSEAETLVRAAFGGEGVVCPAFGDTIPLASCLRSRRRRDLPTTAIRRLYARLCPTCPNNTDGQEA
jgi:hypothetical protein